jgi:IMP cyclohydrolase
MPPRDAMALASLILDYEKDSYDTPRVSAVVDKRDKSGWLAIVRKNGLEVRQMPLELGRFFYVATYEENTLSLSNTGAYDAATAEQACDFILGKGVFADRENPVTAVAAMANLESFDLAAIDFKS